MLAAKEEVEESDASCVVSFDARVAGCNTPDATAVSTSAFTALAFAVGTVTFNTVSTAPVPE